MAYRVKFELTKEQTKKLEKWKKSLPKLEQTHFGINGGGYVYTFIPTSIGDIVKVSREDHPDHKIDLTEYEYF